MIQADRQPLRVIVDSNAKTPATAKALNADAPTLIVVAEDAAASHQGPLTEGSRQS